MIREVVPEDASAITEIYNHYIKHTSITFETELIDAAEMLRRINSTTGGGFPWIVKLDDEGKVVGYAYADLWRKRIAYLATVESAVYVTHDGAGKGWGTALYEELLDRLKQAGNVHVVIGFIAVPNAASVGLHRKLGFEDGGLYREVGRKFDRWVDVLSFQLRMDDWRGGGGIGCPVGD